MDKNSEITPRQAKILAAIVKENCETGQPVADPEPAPWHRPHPKAWAISRRFR